MRSPTRLARISTTCAARIIDERLTCAFDRQGPGGFRGVTANFARIDLYAKAKLSQDIDQGKVVPPGIAGTGPGGPGNDRCRAHELER